VSNIFMDSGRGLGLPELRDWSNSLRVPTNSVTEVTNKVAG